MKENVTQQDANLTVDTVEPVAENSAPESVDKKRKIKFFTAGNMAVMAILTAISYILYMFVKFPLPFAFPGWLDMQISDLPALLGGFALGPVAGCIIIVVKCCLKMPFTSTMCVGELADIIVGIAFVLPASLLYRKFKNRKSAGLGLVVGSVSAIVFSILANWLVLIPFYSSMFGNGDAEAGLAKIVGMVSALYPKVTTDNFYSYYLPLAVLPFNALRCIVCGVITFFTYKPLSKALHWEIKRKPKKSEQTATQDENGVQTTSETAATENSSDSGEHSDGISL